MTPTQHRAHYFHEVSRDQLATGEQRLRAGEAYWDDDIYANDLRMYRRDIILHCLFFYLGLRSEKSLMLWNRGCLVIGQKK